MKPSVLALAPLFPVALLLPAATAGAQGPATLDAVRDFDAYVAQGVRDWEVPGLSIAVVRNDTVLLARGYGERARGEPGAVDEHTLFGIMSTTKAMTAAALAMLVDDGKVAWGDPVSKWLPELQFADPYVTRELTVRDLLLHNSGLGDADLMTIRGDLELLEILGRVQYLEPEYSLRSSFVYQNIMYAAAGEVVARASGMSFPAFLRTRIFTPLGMTRTYPTFSAMQGAGHGAGPGAGDANVSSPHYPVRDSGPVVISDDDHFEGVDAMAASGATWSTAGDMARWARFLLDSARVAGAPLISPESLAELFRPQVLVPAGEFYASMDLTRPRWTSYGMGWFQQDYNGRYIAFHTGSLPGRTALVALVPDARMAVVVLGNLEQSELRQALMLKAIDLFAGTNGAPERDWSAELHALYGGFDEQADADRRERDAARIPDTRPSLPLAAYAGTYLHPAWGSFVIEERGGRLFGVNGAGVRNGGPLEHWHYDTFRIAFEDGLGTTTTLQFVLGPEGTVTQLLGGGRDKYRYDRVR